MSVPYKAVTKYVAPILVALVMAFISAKYLFNGSALNVILWGLLALIWGIVAKKKSEAWILGAIYGFCISFFFLWLDKTGPTPMKQFLELLAIIPLPSLFGAVCGTILSRLTYTAIHLLPSYKVKKLRAD